MTKKITPKPYIVDWSDNSWAKLLPQNDEEWEKWDEDHPSKLLILDDYRQLISEPIPAISKKTKKLLAQFKKYNSNIEIKYLTHKPNTPEKQLPSLIDLYLHMIEHMRRHKKNKKK